MSLKHKEWSLLSTSAVTLKNKKTNTGAIESPQCNLLTAMKIPVSPIIRLLNLNKKLGNFFIMARSLKIASGFVYLVLSTIFLSDIFFSSTIFSLVYFPVSKFPLTFSLVIMDIRLKD